MALRDDVKALAEKYKSLKDTLDTNCQLLDIFEGNLLSHVLAEMKCTVSGRAYKASYERVPPINIMQRMVDKLSTIYCEAPERDVEGTEADQQLWQWYQDQFQIDVQMQVANEYFNMHRATALEPYLDYQKKPRLRSLPRDRFYVYSSDVTDPLRMTHFIKVMGCRQVAGQDSMLLYAYTDSEFIAFNEDGAVAEDVMQQLALSGVDGQNRYGKIPFVYMNRSRNMINPKADNDLLAMTKLLPLQMADVNYSLKFQAFSIIYTIDVDQASLEMNPDVIWDLKSKPDENKKPSVGSIKPELDSDRAIKASIDQLTLFLQARGIRPGAVGDVSSENYAAGISKIVDEMDTTNARKKTVPVFVNGEQELFELITKHMHRIWAGTEGFEMTHGFTQDCAESVTFAEQITVKERDSIIDESVKEMDAGILSKETAMKRVNPEWTDDQIEEELAKIAEEKAGEPAPAPTPSTTQAPDPQAGKAPPPAVNGGNPAGSQYN